MSEKNKDNTKSMAEALRGYVRAIGAEDKLFETNILSQWTDFVGEAVALRTKSKRIVEGVLIVELNSSVIREELHRKKNEVMNKINNAAGKELIRDIFLK